ncbi:TY3B-TY3B protein [Mycena indigotica]|uniref:TY3B-TY3B protein n=1 Tax=Mycena indigotica TaxID=2126181 RepID=A0A8H6W9V9_9AGAR|nr:TY3B-TY3B protein [Mycena indigotica]KAF7310112.1 TY3B-TY3B protein [Mycena indigotica]
MSRLSRPFRLAPSDEELDAQDTYDDLYYSLEASSSDEQGFDIAPRITEPESGVVYSNATGLGSNSALGGNTESEGSSRDTDIPEMATHQDDCPHRVDSATGTASLDTQDAPVVEAMTYTSRSSLNRRSRRRLAQEIKAVNFRVMHTPYQGNSSVVELRKHMARPPGSAFLGASATEALATVGSLNADPVKLQVESSTAPSLLDDEGHAFKVQVAKSAAMLPKGPKASIHRRNKKLRRRASLRKQNREVWALERTVIPPESSVAVRVHAYFRQGQDVLFVERQLRTNGNADDLYGAADSLISSENPILHVANFSKAPVTISAGQILGVARNPSGWLDRMNQYSSEQQEQIHAHANLVRSLAEDVERTEMRGAEESHPSSHAVFGHEAKIPITADASTSRMTR